MSTLDDGQDILSFPFSLSNLLVDGDANGGTLGADELGITRDDKHGQRRVYYDPLLCSVGVVCGNSVSIFFVAQSDINGTLESDVDCVYRTHYRVTLAT